MLFDCSCEETKTLIEEAISKGFALRPKSNTPLCELVKTTTIAPITDLTAKLGEELKAIPLEDMAADSNNSSHNGWTDQTVERAVKIMNRRIEQMRDTVVPVIRDISEQVLRDVENIPQGAEVQNIERYVACDMINVPDFMSRVTANTPVSYLNPDVYFNEEPQSQDQIMELLKLGGQTLDTSLAVAINHIGVDSLWSVWNSLFVDRSKSEGASFFSFDQLVMNNSWGLDYSIIIYILADKLASNNAEASKQYREAAAYWITRHAAAYNTDVERKKLIRERFNERGTIVVNQTVYIEFLQRGGTAEMVLGAAASESRYSSSDEIFDNSKECLRSFTTLKSASFVENSLKLTAAFRTSLQSHFDRSFKNERSEAERGYFEKNPGDESAVISKFEGILPLMSGNSVEDIHRNVARALCMSRFFYMNCQSYLDAVDEGCKAGLSPAEAEGQAILREISTFVVSQITA